jgi:streptogramin lyase
VRVDAATGLALVGLALLAGCSDALEETTSRGDAVVILNAGSDSLTLVTVDQHVVSALAVPPAGAAPAGVAVLGSLLAVSGGDSAALTVFGFDNGQPSSDTTARLAPSVPTGAVAFENDSLIWVANPSRNTVTRLNVRSGAAATFAVGQDPEAVAVVNDVVYVVNANDVNGTPAGPSWMSVLAADAVGPVVPDSAPLTGTNARFITLGDDGFLYVVESGTAGQGDGTLSVVDTTSRSEQAVLLGLGDSPGPLVYHPTGRILVASPSQGILEINTATRTVVRGPGDGVRPDSAHFAALTLDPSGRIYALDQGTCAAPGVLYVFGPPPDYDELATVPVGTCPVAAATVLIP